ncbi:hypothetical protein Vafri_6887 [Volvox africanus]|nr:hypothetical protein Vafri_6887 [Volvox africanus]
MRRLLSAMLPGMLISPAKLQAFYLIKREAVPGGSSVCCYPKVVAGRDLRDQLVASLPQSDGQAAELQQLEEAISRHNNLYYNQQQPEISDAAYDNLKLQYRQLLGQLRGEAPEDVALLVGAPVSAAGPLRKAPHRVPMLSLASVNSREETEAWMEKALAKLPAAGAAAAAANDDDSAAGVKGRRGRGATRQTRNGTRSSISATSPTAAANSSSSGRSHCWVVEPKVDGLAVRALYYRTPDGTYKLEEAATRGDGAVGEDVTHNALDGGISGLPTVLAVPPSCSGGGGLQQEQPKRQRKWKPSDPRVILPSLPAAAAAPAACPEWVEVRGEVFMRTADLELVNRAQEAAGQPVFANTRNAAAGAVRLLDSAECRRRRLSFVAYAALAPSTAPVAVLPTPPVSATSSLSPAPPPASDCADGDLIRPLHASHWETLGWLQDAGFAVSSDNRLCDSVQEALAVAEAWMAKRRSLGYDADGTVIKLDDTTLYDILGTTGSDPRWAVAWKFPAGEAVTRLRDVELTVGRQGQVTPVALLEPVVLGGVTIRRASLHNVGLAVALDLHLGDAVVLRRSGDVIPQVVRVLPELRPRSALPWLPPTACPACGAPLRLRRAANKESGDQLLCDTPECGAKCERKLLHFAAVCLKGSNVSKGAISQLFAAGLIRELPDFYNLDQAVLAALPGFGSARSATLVAAVESSRRMSAATLLRGLNIRLMGEEAAGAVGRAFPRLGDLTTASPEHIAKAAGVGPAAAGSVAGWFQRPENQALLQRLREAGLVCLSGATAPSINDAAPLPPPPAGITATAPATTLAASASSEEGGGIRARRGRPRRRPAAAADAKRPDAPPAESVRDHQEQLDQGPQPGKAEGKKGMESPGGGKSVPQLLGLRGLRVCVTGALMGPSGTGLVRSEVKAMLEEAGAEFHPAVKRSTQVLLAGDDAGGRKLAKAATSGVRVMRELEFWREFWSEGKESAAADGSGGR